MRPQHILVGATAVATTLLVSAPAIAGDPAGPTVETIAEGLSSPLQVQAFRGGALVSQTPEEGAARVTAITDDGTRQDLVYDDGAISGLAYDGTTLAYTYAGGTEEGPVTLLKVRDVTLPGTDRVARGLVPPTGETLANLGRYENRANPDGDQVYGIRGVRNCNGVPRQARPYSGIRESNPYAVEAADDGGWFVADAAANSVLHVDDDGAIETALVLPVQRITITRALAEANDLPRCTVGKTWRYEPVPTDVEEGAAGRLYVTLLPGVPGEGSRGKLIRYNPNNDRIVTLARGLVGATNLALANGRIFVNQLFGNKISVIDTATGQRSAYVRPQQPAASDYFAGALYATTEVFGPAKLIKVTEGALN